MNQERLDGINERLSAQGLDGAVLMPGPNMLYFSGIRTHVSERPTLLFILAGQSPAIIIPSFEAVKARDAGIAEERIFHWADDEGYRGAFQRACDDLELAGNLLGVEALHMRIFEMELLKEHAPGLSTAHAEPFISALRIRKDETEIAAMQKAVRVAEQAMEGLLPRISVSQTEKQIAAMLVEELTKAGSEGNAFEPIVCAGSNSASPHAVPSDRPIQEGDLLTIDWGAIVDDYPSDITRTFAIGQVEPEFVQIHKVVERANSATRKIARPGLSGHELDQVARGVIRESGYGTFFIHRTGHGLGLEIHEPPYIVVNNHEPLQTGAVFTIEPGIYLPRRAGVRIEDDVVLTSEGSRSLTSFPRELITIG